MSPDLPTAASSRSGSAPPSALESEAERSERGLRLVKRLYRPRVFGLALGGLAVAAVLRENGAAPGLWAALAVNALIWPHLAYGLARRAADPRQAELRNLLIDSFLGGVWLPAMGFNLLPSILLVTMLSMDNISVGGGRLLAKGAAALLAGVAASGLALGFTFQPVSSLTVLLASSPMLVLYPLVIGLVAYDLARRLRLQNQELQRVSRVDGLTGIANRGHWESIVVNEFRRFRRNGGAVSLLMVDVDHFKQVNDRHGHPVGDQVLRTVARILGEGVRDVDALGRYGGEEFGIVLVGINGAGARMIAERLRQRFAATPIEAGEGEPICLTISIGIAELTADIDSYSRWVERSDQALYRAKQGGRDRVELWTEAG